MLLVASAVANWQKQAPYQGAILQQHGKDKFMTLLLPPHVAAPIFAAIPIARRVGGTSCTQVARHRRRT